MTRAMDTTMIRWLALIGAVVLPVSLSGAEAESPEG